MNYYSVADSLRDGVSPKRYRLMYGMLLGLIVSCLLGSAGVALEINTFEMKLTAQPGASITKTVTVTNNEDTPTEVSVEVSDWLRTPGGKNILLPEENIARWTLSRTMKKGETEQIVYEVTIPTGYDKDQFTIEGTITTSAPYSRHQVGDTRGVKLPSGDLITVQQQNNPEVLQATRTVKVLENQGRKKLRVTINLQAIQKVNSITVREQFPVNVKAVPQTSIGKFVQVQRSASDWIEVQPNKLILQPKQSRKVTVTVNVPNKPKLSGTYWSIIYLTGSASPVEREGTTIMARQRLGVKEYITITGTQQYEGYITGFKVVNPSIPQFQLVFKNIGNVQLDLTGEIRILNQKGTKVQTIEFDGIPVLPGAQRTFQLKDQEGSQLPPGEYQALAIVDYGASTRAGARTAFTLKPLNLKPIGSANSKPQDLNNDGLYEDVNGDGKFTMQDAIFLGFNYNSSVVQNNVRAFDFDRDGNVTSHDAQVLASQASS